MTEPDVDLSALRARLVEMLDVSRAAERDVFAAIDPATREAPAADGGWSAKDIQAHLSAWKRHMVERLAAIREGREEPPTDHETDAVNAVFHAERADWSWDRVMDDAESTSNSLIDEVEIATDETIGIDRISGSILGNGPEHALAHLRPVAATAGLDSRIQDLADALASMIDEDGWPTRAAAYARYNLACYYALAGRLDPARSLLRQALAAREELREYAPTDDDLIALRDEIPSLSLHEPTGSAQG